jgi:hypothetical protein
MTQIDKQSLAAILAAEGHDLTDDQVLAMTEFLQEVGSVEKAQQAIEALCELKRAA